MTPDQLLGIFQGGLLPLIIKTVLLIIIFIYGIFAVVVVRQVQLMNRVVTEANFSPVLMAVALIHLFAVLAIFFLTVILI